MSPPVSPAHTRFWSGVFRVKGVWNCAASLLFFFFDDTARDWLGVPLPDVAYRAMFLALAFTFGLGYWRVGQDLTTNRDIVKGGVIGQMSVFGVVAYEVFVAQRLPPAFLGPGVIDLIFAVLFLIFLSHTRHQQPSSRAGG